VRPPWRQPSARESLPPATVLLASTGKPFSDAAIARAAGLAAGDCACPRGDDPPSTPRGGASSAGRVRVVTVAKIHGSSFGLQHPGLMPNKKERDQAQAIVATAIKALQRAGTRADGEVVITRSPGRSFARAARAARDVRHVVIDDYHRGRLGRLLAGAVTRSVRYRLKGVDCTAVSGGIVHDADRGHRQEAGGHLDELDRAV
jgi:nucleotide-binding universal stress UspA family protein